MRKIIIIVILISLLVPAFLSAQGADEKPAAWWRFDEGRGEAASEAVSGKEDPLRGLTRFAPGVSGTAVRFDGFSSAIVRAAEDAPELERAFSVEAWVALGAYPWNWAPIISRHHKRIIGFFFGIDSHGNLGFHVSDGSSIWRECNTRPRQGKLTGLDLRTWYHVVGTCEPGVGLTVYVDGEPAGSLPLKRRPVFAPRADLRMGRDAEPLPPTDPVRAWATYPSWYSLDGILDEVKLHNRVLSAADVRAAYRAVRPAAPPDLPPRRFPTLDKPSGRFGADFTRLEFYPEWDAIWPVGDFSDIVVQFDELPVKVMFWRGTRYSPCWVSENGKWMADQSRETGYNWYLRDGSRDELPTGCMEHMSDVQCRSSRVSIIENNDARALVHWRYLQMDVRFRQRDLDNQTGFGEWADEYYYVYPDGVAVRKLGPGRGGWQETIFFSEPGTRPEDNCELEAVTLVNEKGESRTYSWAAGFPVFDLEDAVIQMTNLKSKYRPFMILRPGARFKVFSGEVRPEYSRFPWWNHWPVAQVSSDGRYASAPDRAAHSSLSWGGPRGEAALYGMTDRPAESLAPLARSWNHPPEIRAAGEGFEADGYDYKQRAYLFTRNRAEAGLEIEFDASEASPVVNPALVIRNWGERAPELRLDGEAVPRGADFRWGIEHTVSGRADLVVWIRRKSTAPVEISLLPSGPPS